MREGAKAKIVLTMNTIAFTVCFAAWMMYGVLITYLVDNGVYNWDKAQMGWLIGIPVLTGSIFRLPVGVLTDKYGGRLVYTGVMLIAAVGCYLTSFAHGFWQFFGGGLAFGLAGTSFAVGIAYTSIWFPQSQQGTALGIFGAGNAGAALTSMGAPLILRWLTGSGAEIDQWRSLPRIYAAVLLGTAILFWLGTWSRRIEHSRELSLKERLRPLRHVRVWRFGLYYFLVFGGFVALAQWLIPYYVNAYAMSVATAGLLASIFSLPSGVIRALGGWMSDVFGARRVMYWVLGGSAVACALLIVPRMDIYAPGQGIMAVKSGAVERVDATTVTVAGRNYNLQPEPAQVTYDQSVAIWPKSRFWHEPVVHEGEAVVKKQLLARGVTHVYFQANVWIFTGLVFVVGILLGIGKAAVYKHIPTYFPHDVGVVGGIVGVLGGLGGFVCPILFGYLLRATGLWTTCWVFFLGVALLCLVWMHHAIRSMIAHHAPEIAEEIERPHPQAGDIVEVLPHDAAGNVVHPLR